MRRSIAMVGGLMMALMSSVALGKGPARVPTEITVSVYDVSAKEPVLLSSRPMVVLPVAVRTDEQHAQDWMDRLGEKPLMGSTMPALKAPGRSPDADFSTMQQWANDISTTENRFSPLDFEGKHEFTSTCIVGAEGNVLLRKSQVNTGLAGTAEASNNKEMKVNLMFSSIKRIEKIEGGPSECNAERVVMNHAFLIKQDLRLVKGQEMVIAHTNSDASAPKLEFHLLWQ